ncbi:MAG: endonuclease, partial [Prevotellaceae bacterium]|nr:endonuclease [Prevotellaceae bacterium]
MSLNFTGKLFFASIFSIASALSFAQPRADYYTSSTLDGKRGSELELALKAIVYPHTKIKYDHLWEAYETTDPGPSPDSIPSSYHGGKTDLVYDMYAWMSQFPKFYSDKDHSQTGGFNREHAVPNSWWGGESGNAIAYTDLHHLVPGDGAANNAKQNYPLGEYKAGMTLVWPTETKKNENGKEYVKADAHDHSKMPCHVNASHVWKTTSTTDYDGVTYFFEPADEYKGDFARMYFYVVCAYEGIDWKVNDMFTTVSGHTTIKPWALDMLLKWHNADKVSKKERDRNNAVESLQGNRNPFIDYPELVDYIWGSKSSESFCLSNATSSYSEEYSTRPSAKWKLGGEYVSSVTAMLGEDFTSPTLEVDAKMACTTQYTSDDESVATIDADGVVTLNALGTTTITATVTPVEPSIPAATATYILTVEKPVDPACYFAETFDNCNGTGANDDEWSGSIAQGSVKADYEGWTLNNVFGANHCIKVGTAEKVGSVTTPSISFAGDAVITFKAGAWNIEKETTDITITATNGTLSESSITLTKGAWTDYRLYLPGVTGSTKITFTAKE